jgi:hypothetical protein
MLLLSYSSISRYKSCPRKYQLSTKWKEDTSSSALFFGKAVEAGIEALLLGNSFEAAYDAFMHQWKFEDGDPTKPVYENIEVSFYNSDYDIALMRLNAQIGENILGDDWEKEYKRIAAVIKNQEEVPTEDELMAHHLMNWHSMALKAEYMMKAFAEEILPDVELVEFEGEPAAQLPIINEIIKDESATRGFIDFVVKVKGIDLPVIIDCKTASSLYDDHTLATSSQLRTYVQAMRNKTGKDYLGGYWVLHKKMSGDKFCSECGWKATAPTYKHCAECKAKNSVHGKPKGTVQFIVAEFDDEAVNDLVEDTKYVTTGIKNKVFFKNENNCMQYNKPCPFYDVCWAGADPSELSHLKEKESKHE